MVNTKFRTPSPELSEKLQKVLFSLGYEWEFGGKEVKYTVSPFLYVEPNGFMTHGASFDVF